MIITSFYDVREMAREYNFIPVCKEIYADVATPISILRKISAVSKKQFLFESVEMGGKMGEIFFYWI